MCGEEEEFSVFCPVCGEMIDAGDAVCPMCGTPV